MREKSLQILTEVLRKQENVVALWEGGSAATGRLDQYSDIDLNMVLSDEDDQSVWDVIDDAVAKVFPIEVKWIVDGTAIQGFSQQFYLPKKTENYFFLDIGIFKQSAPDLYLDKERHGFAKFLFDKSGKLKTTHLDLAAFEKKIERRLEQIKNQFEFMKIVTIKEIKRNRPIDAYGFYQACLRMLNEALGIRYRPYKFDFGFRYQFADMPAEIQTKMQELIFVGNFSELEPKLREVEKLFHASLRK